jgi:catechol 2,3-dioxygenase-like lactoylglutathione lyase family enzyme
MPSAIAGIDHVIVGVRDLERARQTWARLGFTLTPRGRHLGQGTANYCMMFAGDYIELLGVVAPDEFGHRLETFLKLREGAMAAGFAPSGSAEASAAALRELGLHPSEPRPLGRALELPEGTVTPRFSLVNLPSEETPGLDCFICAHLTPELMRRPQWLDHANGVTGLKAIHILVAETAPLLPAWDRLLGIAQVTTTDAVAALQIGRHRLVFSSPDDFLTMHPGLEVDPAFPLPGIAALEFAVADRGRTAAALRDAEVPFTALPGGGVTVPRSAANGTLLFFV